MKSQQTRGSNCARIIDLPHGRGPQQQTRVAHDNSTWHAIKCRVLNKVHQGDIRRLVYSFSERMDTIFNQQLSPQDLRKRTQMRQTPENDTLIVNKALEEGVSRKFGVSPSRLVVFSFVLSSYIYIYIHIDITEMVDWALKTNHLPTHLLSYRANIAKVVTVDLRPFRENGSQFKVSFSGVCLI